MRKSY